MLLTNYLREDLTHKSFGPNVKFVTELAKIVYVFFSFLKELSRQINT